MLIGIDGRALIGPQAGSGRYVTELCRVLDVALPQARFVVYCSRAVDLPVESGRWSCRGDQDGRWSRLSPFMWYVLRAGRLAAKDKVTSFWGGTNFLPLGLPSHIRAVVTVLDVVHRVFPQSMGLKHRLAFGGFFWASLRRADVVASISEGTAARLAELGYRKADLVVRPGVSGRFKPQAASDITGMRERLGLGGRYLLALSTLEPRKNFVTLVDAYLAMRHAGELGGVALVLAGQSGWKNAALEARIEEARAAGAEIQLTGRVPEALLPALYAGAEAVVMPSIYEGFGLPVLEARLCGARVVATDIPEIREAGGNQGIYVQPNVAGIQAGIRCALMSPRPDVAAVTQDYPRWETEGRKLAKALADLERS